MVGERKLRHIGTCELLDAGIYKMGEVRGRKSAMQHMKSEEEVRVIPIEIY